MSEFEVVGKVSEFEDNVGRAVPVDGRMVAVFRKGDEWYAIDDWHWWWEPRMSSRATFRHETAWSLVLPIQALILLLGGGLLTWVVRRERRRKAAA